MKPNRMNVREEREAATATRQAINWIFSALHSNPRLYANVVVGLIATKLMVSSRSFNALFFLQPRQTSKWRSSLAFKKVI